MLGRYPNLQPEAHGDFMRPINRTEKAKMLIYGTIGSMMIYGSEKLTSHPLAENGAAFVGTTALLLGVKQLYGATISNYFPEIVKGYATSGVENAKYYGWCAGRSTINLVNSGIDNTEYLVWCIQRSTKNVARTAILAARPVVPSPTL